LRLGCLEVVNATANWIPNGTARTRAGPKATEAKTVGKADEAQNEQ
jgi:hypothetical protein